MSLAATDQARAETRVKSRRFKVDLWATDVNDVEIGIMKQTQHRSQSRQFTKDMEIIGQITDDGERTGLIAFRQGLWEDETGPKKRLVIKLFSETLNWRASLDMMTGRSLQLTHGSGGVPVTAYSVNIARREQIIHVERSAHKWPLFPEKFSFFILSDDGPEFYRLRKDLFTIGADYTLFDQYDQKIGHIDRKLFNLGGAWKVRIDADRANATLETVLQLFCAMLRFNNRSRRHIKGLADDMKAGRMTPKLDHHEEDLYMNPRRMR